MAGKLATVKAIPSVGENDEAHLRVEATFTPQTLDRDSDQFSLTIGIYEALLVMEHAGYDRLEAVEANLASTIWTAEHKTLTESKVSGSAMAGVKAKVAAYFVSATASAQAEASASHANFDEHHGKATYPIIRATTEGWQIGGPEGDPRCVPSIDPKKKWMLNGSYFNGLGEARSHNGPYSAKLRHKIGANDYSCRALLYAAHDGFRVEIKRRSDANPATTTTNEVHKLALKEAIVRACLQRAKTERTTSGALPEHVNKDVFLASHVTAVPHATGKKIVR